MSDDKPDRAGLLRTDYSHMTQPDIVEAYRKQLAKMTDHDIVQLLQDRDDPLSRARASFYHNCAKLEQLEAQNKPPGVMAVRRIEFEAALDIIDAFNGTARLKKDRTR